MADGGEVKSYCSDNQPHRKGCKYFKAGGDVHPLDIPQHQNPQDAVAGYLMHGGLHGLLKMKSEDPAFALDKYNHSIAKGHKALDARIKSFFGGNKQDPGDHENGKKNIDKWISDGGITNDIQQEIFKQNAPQGFAEGGKVHKTAEGVLHQNPITDAYPEQNMLLNNVKGRASDYLNNLKPQKNSPQFSFDAPMNNPHEKKSYETALNIAANPLHVLDQVHSGKIEPEHVSHFKNLYPEVDDVVQKKLTHRILEAQLNNEKPPHHVRQGLSLLMGTPLSGELSPQNIQAAQAVFQNQKAAPQQQGQPPKKTSSLTKASQSYLLPNQAAAMRQQKQ